MLDEMNNEVAPNLNMTNYLGGELNKLQRMQIQF